MTPPTDEQLAAWGRSLREIDPSMLIREEGETVRWFLGDNATEVFTWTRGGAITHVQLVFARVSVEWTEERGVVTGTFRSGGAIAGGRYDPYLLTQGQAIDPDVAKAARTLLEASSVERAAIAPLLEALRAVGS